MSLGSRVGQFRDIKQLWEWTKGHLTIEEINKILLLSTDNNGRTVWNLAAKGKI
jgi:hypothetical protein